MTIYNYLVACLRTFRTAHMYMIHLVERKKRASFELFGQVLWPWTGWVVIKIHMVIIFIALTKRDCFNI
jgi:hypothetical protein